MSQCLLDSRCQSRWIGQDCISQMGIDFPDHEVAIWANRKKCVFATGKHSKSWASLRLAQGCEPDPDKVVAIQKMPHLTCKDTKVWSVCQPCCYFSRKIRNAEPVTLQLIEETKRLRTQHRVPDQLSRAAGCNGHCTRVNPDDRAVTNLRIPCAKKEGDWLVVPKALRGSAMHLAHAGATAGHPCVYRTYCKLRDYFYFPNMLATVKEYVGTCRSCQKRKGMAYHAPLAAAPQASYPLERVSADLMELEVTSQGNKYVLAFIDQLTRYVQLIPLPSKEAETVADAFINQFVTVFGPPRLLQTNNGREFKNNLFKRVCELASVQTIFTTAFHPQANGMIERTNRVVKNALATLLEASPLEWDKLLPYVPLAMNSAVHRSVGDQPLYLLTGHIGAYPVGNSNYEETDHEAAQSFAARLRRAREIDVRGVGRRGALGPRRFGPARIFKKTGPVTRLVRVLPPPYKEKIYHLNQLRPYRTNDELHLPDDAELDEDGDVDDPPPLDGLPDDIAVALLASFCRPPDDD
ncbi:uncharacterized protein LOC119594838 [Penaeus monodon]|uniref:uncharacterized protein LOC119594838 n=1 Tax=Penaeus monodon TaxID=6687 RepID=UPI0018A7DB25|nr:uncharacterized protein LOC119594838 [Penaeus monodon]